MRKDVQAAYTEMRSLAARERTEAEHERMLRLLQFFNWLEGVQRRAH